MSFVLICRLQIRRKFFFAKNTCIASLLDGIVSKGGLFVELELQKYECHNDEYLIYDCNRNHYEFGAREARVMCSLSVGLCARKVLVGPIMNSERKGDMSMQIYNPDGTLAQPQTEDVKVFSKYLEDAGYDRTLRSDTGICSAQEEIHKVCKMAFFENFIEKYNLKNGGK